MDRGLDMMWFDSSLTIVQVLKPSRRVSRTTPANNLSYGSTMTSLRGSLNKTWVAKQYNVVFWLKTQSSRDFQTTDSVSTQLISRNFWTMTKTESCRTGSRVRIYLKPLRKITWLFWLVKTSNRPWKVRMFSYFSKHLGADTVSLLNLNTKNLKLNWHVMI